MRRPGFLLAGTLTIALCGLVPAGCQLAPPASIARADSPTIIVRADSPASIVLGGSPASPDEAGSATVVLSFGKPQGGRAVQATVADADHIDLTLSQAGRAYRSLTIAKAAIAAGGSASATFDMLWPGGATLSAQVRNAAGALIGAGNAATSIAPGQVATLSIAITLVPTEIRRLQS